MELKRVWAMYFQPDRRNGKGSQNNGAGCSREIELALGNL